MYLGAHQISTVGCLALALFSSRVNESVVGENGQTLLGSSTEQERLN